MYICTCIYNNMQKVRDRSLTTRVNNMIIYNRDKIIIFKN